ncbi:hypothetical protein HJFPF1_06971 [Paramyrothecium foliicola]|nr:hypothetical protein HJFPF1_06971 [Paramyrothecium foliicola]
MVAIEELASPPGLPSQGMVVTIAGTATTTAAAEADSPWTTPHHHGGFLAAGPTETLDPSENRFLAMMSNGTDAERVLRGFLFGVVVGLAIAIFACCWLPCFRRARGLERRQLGLGGRIEAQLQGRSQSQSQSQRNAAAGLSGERRPLREGEQGRTDGGANG